MVDAERIDMKFRKACQVILEGYERTLREGGRPIVLAENETDLEKLGVQALKARGLLADDAAASAGADGQFRTMPGRQSKRFRAQSSIQGGAPAIRPWEPWASSDL